MLKFNSMPNFRSLVKPDVSNDNIKRNENLFIYRSSRPDFLTSDEIDQFKKLNIKSIVDFRSFTEYRKSAGSKDLDAIYPIYKVKYPFNMKYKPGDHVTAIYKQTTSTKSNRIKPIYTTSDKAIYEKHFLIDFFNLRYVWAVFNRAPLFFRIYSLLYLLFDVVFFTGYKYFVRIFAEKVLNKEGLSGQYFDMVEHSQAAIYSALKILSDKSNLPAMINCAHGKDRTGVVSAMVLSCLGMSDDYISDNYAESTKELDCIRKRLENEIVERHHLCPSFVSSDKQTMLDLLNYINIKYKSVSNYLDTIGFTISDQERLKENFL